MHQKLERHRIKRTSWLRAAVLGANDGIISTSCLLVGVAAAHTSSSGILIAGIAGLIAGAMSMAAGEYISVSSQADTEKADLKREEYELATAYSDEVEELRTIYIKRGLDSKLAKEVALQLMAKNPLEAHARDELGITEVLSAKPLQAAFFSAVSFTLGAILPLLVIFIASTEYLIFSILLMSIIFLSMLGIIASKIGGSNILKGTLRVTLWGTLAMLISAGIGKLLGIVI